MLLKTYTSLFRIGYPEVSDLSTWPQVAQSWLRRRDEKHWHSVMLCVTRAVHGASLYVHVLVHQPIHNCLHATLKISQVLSIFVYRAAAAAKSLQSCPNLCDPTDSSPPGSPAPGILQARTLEWVAISFSNAWKWKVKVKSLSCVRLLASPWTAAYHAPPSMGFSRQKYWSGVPLPSPS